MQQARLGNILLGHVFNFESSTPQRVCSEQLHFKIDDTFTRRRHAPRTMVCQGATDPTGRI